MSVDWPLPWTPEEDAGAAVSPATWHPLRDLVARHSDIDRPLRLAQVLDTSQWAATGASFVQVLVADAARLAIYRDGPRPPVGSYLQVVQTGPEASAPWLALPLPQPVAPPAAFCTDFAAEYLISAQRVADGTWHVLHLAWDHGTPTWTIRAPHPAASGDYRPLWIQTISFSANTTRYFTYAPGDALYYSDDGGFTWAKATGSDGLTFLYQNLPTEGSVTPQHLAVTPTSILRSDDLGLTWRAVYGADPAGGEWRYAATLAYSVFAGNAPGNIVTSAVWSQYTAVHLLVSTAGAMYTVNNWHPYDFRDVDPYGTPAEGTYIDPHTGSDRPPLYGYYALPGGIAVGRHAFRVLDDEYDLSFLLQANGDPYTYVDPGPYGGGGGGEASGAAFWPVGGPDMVDRWGPDGATFAGHPYPFGAQPNLIHPAKGGESEYSNGLLVADRDNGDGYALRDWEGRASGANWTFVYDNARNHPTGKAGVGLRDSLYDPTCILAALDDPSADGSQFALGPANYVVNAFTDATSPPNYVAGAFHDLSAGLVAQLGARFVASHGGLTPVYGTPPAAPAPYYSVAGGGRAATSAPTGWQLPAYDDSAWAATVLAAGLTGVPGGALVRPDATTSPSGYFRQVFPIPAGVTTATLHLAANDAGLTLIAVNGTAFYAGPAASTTYNLDISAAIVPGASNLLAFAATAVSGSTTAVAFKVEFA